MLNKALDRFFWFMLGLFIAKGSYFLVWIVGVGIMLNYLLSDYE